MGHDAFSLDGEVAVVTGGSRGIGEEIAVAMAESGADVAPVARSEDALEATADRIEATGQTAALYPLNVMDLTSVAAMFEDVEATLGEVDILVNNAGTNPFFGNAKELDVDTWQKIFDVNTTGAFYCARKFGRQVDDRDGTGAIVNVASVGGVVALPYQVPYTASKHAMVGMTKGLAVEWAPEIRVNALAPGYVRTEFTEGVRENEDIHADILDTIPANRFAEPEEIASIAVYLASDAAAYVTGEIHVADGGIAAQ
jgi:NAD(P)-dependent dehydrogenase (short-subunit alcohol dehydrogenase family)